jgi:hypothetical protein
MEEPNDTFFLISQKNVLKKAQRGATLSTQGVYKGAKGRKERGNLKNKTPSGPASPQSMRKG